MKPFRIFIDAGHGGPSDNGASWGEKFDYVEEDDLNLIIAFLLRYELLLADFDVRMSREKDEPVTLGRRVALANYWPADIFVSIHADAFHNITAKGISTHIYTYPSQKSLILAAWIQGGLIKKFIDHTDRGVKKSNFYVLHHTAMPAVLVECEFISNPETRRFLKEPENQIALAQAIGQGIKKYFETSRGLS